MSKKRVLVTGSAGFLGRTLLPLLQREGHQITGTYLNEKPFLPGPRVQYACLDILNSGQVFSLIQKLRPDWIFHLAGMAIARDSWRDIAGTFQANVYGTLHILEAVRRLALPSRFFLASSIQVYGRQFRKKEKIEERTVFWPETPYAATKAIAELAALDYAGRFGLDVVVGRFANSVGPGQPSVLVFSEWCRQIARIEQGQKKAVLETGNLQVYREFLHAQDTAAGMLVLMKKGRRGEVYNVASGKACLLKDYARFLAGRCSRKIHMQTRKSHLRSYDPVKISVSAAKLKKLGWQPRRRIEEGLLELLQEWRAREKGQKA